MTAAAPEPRGRLAAFRVREALAEAPPARV